MKIRNGYCTTLVPAEGNKKKGLIEKGLTREAARDQGEGGIANRAELISIERWTPPSDLTSFFSFPSFPFLALPSP